MDELKYVFEDDPLGIKKEIDKQCLDFEESFRKHLEEFNKPIQLESSSFCSEVQTPPKKVILKKSASPVNSSHTKSGNNLEELKNPVNTEELTTRIEQELIPNEIKSFDEVSIKTEPLSPVKSTFETKEEHEDIISTVNIKQEYNDNEWDDDSVDCDFKQQFIENNFPKNEFDGHESDKVVPEIAPLINFSYTTIHNELSNLLSDKIEVGPQEKSTEDVLQSNSGKEIQSLNVEDKPLGVLLNLVDDNWKSKSSSKKPKSQKMPNNKKKITKKNLKKGALKQSKISDYTTNKASKLEVTKKVRFEDVVTTEIFESYSEPDSISLKRKLRSSVDSGSENFQPKRSAPEKNSFENNDEKRKLRSSITSESTSNVNLKKKKSSKPCAPNDQFEKKPKNVKEKSKISTENPILEKLSTLDKKSIQITKEVNKKQDDNKIITKTIPKRSLTKKEYAVKSTGPVPVINEPLSHQNNTSQTLEPIPERSQRKKESAIKSTGSLPKSNEPVSNQNSTSNPSETMSRRSKTKKEYAIKSTGPVTKLNEPASNLNNTLHPSETISGKSRLRKDYAVKSTGPVPKSNGPASNLNNTSHTSDTKSKRSNTKKEFAVKSTGPVSKINEPSSSQNKTSQKSESSASKNQMKEENVIKSGEPVYKKNEHVFNQIVSNPRSANIKEDVYQKKTDGQERTYKTPENKPLVLAYLCICTKWCNSSEKLSAHLKICKRLQPKIILNKIST